MRKMSCAAVIAEFNPFHRGHAYLLEKTRELTGADFVIALMSGNFTQGGEPACMDKWERAKKATKSGGADVVFELPFVYACNSAYYFARGAMDILRGLGCVGFLVFGSESGELSELEDAAFALTEESEDFKAKLSAALSEGKSFPAARAEALGGKRAEILSGPNNVLAVEYLRQLIENEDDIQPITVKRRGAAFDSEAAEGEYPSARAIRKLKYSERLEAMDGALFDLLRGKIFGMSEAELSEVFAVSEGLENRFKLAAREANSLGEFIDAVKSKRYTRTRIRRICCQLLLGLDKESFGRIESAGEKTLYARLLGFNDRGAKLLRAVKKSECSRIPLITNINRECGNDAPYRESLDYDIAAGDLYALLSGRPVREASDYVRMPEKSGF